MGFNIAIDGPAGAGKSTVARKAAERLGFIYVDTGAMYRTIALYLLRKQIDCDDYEALSRALENLDVAIDYQDGVQQMLLNGENVSALIRTEEIGTMASVVSAKPQVREKLLALQRELARTHDVIMDGRDIGTMILPDAALKIYLTATPEARAQRRYLELTQKGVNCDLKTIEKEIRERDERDMNREIAPLRQAEDAVYLDTSLMDAGQAVDEVIRLAKERSTVWK